MRQAGKILYMILAMVICMVPSVGMIFRPTTETSENKEMAAWPSVTEDGSWNENYLEEAGEYFDDHFAFRPELVASDARIRGELFGVSSSDQVILGRDGWLYYEATSNDYLRQTQISDRAIYNIAHNVALMQQYVESQGSQFLFTVTPNKNSLYGEYMPYYYRQTALASNAERLKPYLEQEGVHYLDLFELFEDQEEILYLKRDSHWNNKGALLAYNAMMDQVRQPHDTYEDTPYTIDDTYIGDLNSMLYPVGAIPEENQVYDLPQNYAYVTDTRSVEDSWIQTINPQASGSLLMYRDSFGNTLLPFVSNAWENAWYSQYTPYSIQLDMESCLPDTVIVERVERHLTALGQNPPYMESPQAVPAGTEMVADTQTTVSVSDAGSFYGIQGILDDSVTSEDCRIYVRCTDGAGNVRTMEAFPVTRIEGSRASDYGYQCYIRKESVSTGSCTMEILVESQGTLTKVQTWNSEF
ncbi:MAG TPA: hypothetical protein IAA57_07015 [Candidatus Pullilachnospira intestinigallinarum]|nr:hypothetical protein [Candidatus Pullilachnospira intestinigallinarum]